LVAHFSGMTYNNDYFQTAAANRAAPPTVSF